jgi:hypothetical protein
MNDEKVSLSFTTGWNADDDFQFTFFLTERTIYVDTPEEKILERFSGSMSLAYHQYSDNLHWWEIIALDDAWGILDIVLPIAKVIAEKQMSTSQAEVFLRESGILFSFHG